MVRPLTPGPGVAGRRPAAIGLATVAVVLAPGAAAEPVTFSCYGREFRHTADFSRRLEASDPFSFSVVFDSERGRLIEAPVQDTNGFEFRLLDDAILFFRDRRIDVRSAHEWITINRSGRYVHFVTFRDPHSGALRAPPIVLASANCKGPET